MWHRVAWIQRVNAVISLRVAQGDLLNAGLRPQLADSVRKQRFGHNIAMGIAFNVLGLVGSFMISASLVPQILKVYRTKSAKDLSRSFQLLSVAGLILVAVYGHGESLWPIWIPVVIELAGGLTLLVMKFVYDGRESKQAATKDRDLDLEAGAAESESESPVPTKYKLAITPT